MAALKSFKIYTPAFCLSKSTRNYVTKVFYAVGRGRETGIYNSWEECKSKITGYQNCKFKKFFTSNEAEEFVNFWKNSPLEVQVEADKKDITGSNSHNKVAKKQPKTQKKPKASLEPSSDATTVLQNDAVDSEFSKAKLSQLNVTLEETLKINESKELQKKEESKRKIKNKENLGTEEATPVALAATATTITAMPTINTSSNPKISKNGAPDSKEAKEKVEKSFSSNSSNEARQLTYSHEHVSKSLRQFKDVEKNNYSFRVDENNYVEVYTDGSASPSWGAGSKGGLGVWFGEDHPLNISKSAEGVRTSNVAEIEAAIAAIQAAKGAGIKKLKIITDSEFVINAATRWIYNWRRNGWVLKTGEPVKLKNEVLKLYNETTKMDIRWEKVNAHSGIEGNESAHRLAERGAEKNYTCYP